MNNLVSFLDYDEIANFSNNNSLMKQEQNLQAFTLYDYPSYFLIEPNYRITKISSLLQIEKKTLTVTSMSFFEKPKETCKKMSYQSLLMGRISLKGHYFLLFVEQVMHCAFIEAHEIFQIRTLVFIPFEDEKDLKLLTEYNEILSEISIIKKIFSIGFYFSFSYDLTSSRQRQHENLNQEFDEDFWWNHHLLKDFLKQNIEKNWIIPIIQGFVKKFSVFIMGKKLDYILISRKMSKMAGTRFSARGINDSGYVANYVETEQLIYYSHHSFSFVQVRGSLPLFWSQSGVSSALRLTRSIDASEPAYLLHMDYMQKHYRLILFINLLSIQKEGEKMLTEGIERLIQETEQRKKVATHFKDEKERKEQEEGSNYVIKIKNEDQIIRLGENLKENKHKNGENFCGLSNDDSLKGGLKYEYFDFHRACKGQKYENVEGLLDRIGDQIHNFGFFGEKKGVTLVRQEGVVRINCLDCLDRTNAVMTKIAAVITQFILEHLKVDLAKALGANLNTLLHIPSLQDKKFHPFIFHFKNIWADNGDILSLHYSGTGSTISKITRTSKVGFMNMLDHGFKSINRFFINNFEDHFKQQGIDLILGEKSKREDEYGDLGEIEMQDLVNFYDLNLFILTQSLKQSSQKSMKKDIHLLLGPFSELALLPEILILNFQDLESELEGLFMELLMEEMKQRKNYIELLRYYYCGLSLLIFIDQNIKGQVKNIEISEANLGLFESAKFKAGLVLKMNIDDSPLCLINCRLTNQKDQFRSRVKEINKLYTHAVNFLKEDFDESDYRFLVGNLGLNLNLPFEEINKELIKIKEMMNLKEEKMAEKIIKSLFLFDEGFEMKKDEDAVLNLFDEGEVKFLPNANWKEGDEKKGDLFFKNPDPAWNDRIMHKSLNDSVLSQVAYSKIECSISTHKPVFSLYKIRIKKIKKDIKEDGFKIISNYIEKTPVKDKNV